MGANEDLGHFSVALPALVTSSQSLDASWPHAGVSHLGCNHFDERHEHDLCRLMLPKHQVTSLDAVVFPSHNSCTSGMLEVWTFSWIESVFSDPCFFPSLSLAASPDCGRAPEAVGLQADGSTVAKPGGVKRRG